MSLESDIKSMVSSLGLSLYDTEIVSENGETIYRVIVSNVNDSKVSMDQIVETTKLISPMLDVTPPLSGEYRLEVSSPGIERKLKNLEHFKNSIGEKVAIVLDNKEKYRGTLVSVDGNEIMIETADDGAVKIDYSDIVKARTYFEW